MTDPGKDDDDESERELGRGVRWRNRLCATDRLLDLVNATETNAPGRNPANHEPFAGPDASGDECYPSAGWCIATRLLCDVGLREENEGFALLTESRDPWSFPILRVRLFGQGDEQSATWHHDNSALLQFKAHLKHLHIGWLYHLADLRRDDVKHYILLPQKVNE